MKRLDKAREALMEAIADLSVSVIWYADASGKYKAALKAAERRTMKKKKTLKKPKPVSAQPKKGKCK